MKEEIQDMIGKLEEFKKEVEGHTAYYLRVAADSLFRAIQEIEKAPAPHADPAVEWEDEKAD